MKFVSIATMFVSVAVASAASNLRKLSGGGGCFDCVTNNPCDPLDTKDLFYYSHCEASKFVQCSESGECYVLDCPEGVVWDETTLTCSIPVPCYSCEVLDPCKPLAMTGKFYYAHCDPAKFVQCSRSGQCFDVDCSEGTTWDETKNTCDF